MNISETFQFVIMICAIAKLFYTIGKDICKQKKDNDSSNNQKKAQKNNRP